MKRIFALFLSLLLLIPAVSAAEDQPVFHLEGASGNVGDTVTVVGSVQNMPAIASFQVIMTYDTAVLEPVSGKKLDCSGLFMINTDANYNGKKAVNALSADAALAAKGDTALFSVAFKIIGAPANAEGSPVEVAFSEFTKADLSDVTTTVEPCLIQVLGTGGTSTPEEGTTDDGSTGTDGAGNGSANDNATAAETPTGPTAPTGSWIFDQDTVLHLEEDGTLTTYQGDYQKDSSGETDRVTLYQDGQKAGELTVEEQEDGKLNVVQQQLGATALEMPAANKPTLWIVLGIGLGVLALGGAAVLFLKRKKEAAAAETAASAETAEAAEATSAAAKEEQEPDA